MKMKLVLSTLIVLILFPSCQKEKGCIDPTAINYNIDAEVDDGSCIYNTIITGTITELDAQATITIGQLGPVYSGDYSKFSFSEGGVVDGDNWDIAFRSTHIIVNGGLSSDTTQPERTGNAAVYIIDGTMEDITLVDESLLMQDGALSSAIINDLGVGPNGGAGVWCTYSNQMITPNAGKILVFRTYDNKYAKIEILNFYDATMSNIYGGFYTFNYVYQSNENTLNF